MHKSIKIIIFGLGKVGRELLIQLQNSGLRYQIIALADSSGCLTGRPLTTDQIASTVQAKTSGQAFEHLDGALSLDRLPDTYAKDTIIVDTSAVRDPDWSVALQKGSKLVFANKNALSTYWQKASVLYNLPAIRYEATVGAGLPVINTLRTMTASGDQIIRIEGAMSGTLGFLCSRLEEGTPYSQAVRGASEDGYTEPDPRDDLSGFDILRKALILARTSGWELEQDDFSIQPLYDDRLVGIPVAEFFQRTSLLDHTYAQQVEAAAQEGKVLRYMATITPQGGNIGLKAVERNSALGTLKGPGNYFAIYSHYYNEIPLVISGPGAGVAVTANGVLNDIIALSSV
jgi:homoserine dehydrogenase